MLPNGDLVAVGDFTSAGGVAASRVARWNGTAWSPLGLGLDGPAAAAAVLPNGDLVVGGSFLNAGGSAANRVARWDGVAWSPLGSGLDGNVTGLDTLPNGGLVVSGPFTVAGASPANQVAVWNAGNWQPWNLGLPPSAISVRRAIGLPNGDLLLAGSFGIDGIVRWNGSTATQLGAGLQSYPSTWPGPGGPTSVMDLCALPGGDLLVVGTFHLAGGVPALCMARWDGSAWSGLSPGMLSTILDSSARGIRDVAQLPNGNLVVVGDFVATGPSPARNVAEWNGLEWLPIASGVPVTASSVCVLANGDVVVGGFFTSIGGVAANSVARWDGNVWHPMGGGFPGRHVGALVEAASGEVFAAASITSPQGATTLTIARWNGTTWLPLPAFPFNVVAWVSRLVAQPNGSIVAAGAFYWGTAMAGLARWNGSQWQPLGQGLQGTNGVIVTDAVSMPNGDLVVCGNFDTAGGVPCDSVARWNGTVWSSLDGFNDDQIDQLCVLPNGDLLGYGSIGITGSQAAASIGRWNGQSWQPVGSADGRFLRMVGVPGGDVVAVGTFATLGTIASPYIARLTTNCPASVVSYAPGCPSSTGASFLAATQPWAGSSVFLTAGGLPVGAVVASVTGLSTISFPLSTVFPAPAPCILSVAPDHFTLSLAVAGMVTARIDLPNDPALGGLGLNHQMVVFELSPTLQVMTTSVSNAVALTIGAF